MTIQYRTFALAITLGLGVCLCGSSGCGPQPIRSDGGGPSDAPDERDGEAARVVQVRGPGGLTSPSLPEGTFLGEGAQLGVGQTVQTPRGVQSELRLTDGQVVRANERTEITLGSKDAGVTLGHGEIVLLLVGTEPITVGAGDDRLDVLEGEVLVRRTDEGNTFSVVTGRAELTRGAETVSLGAGSSVSPDAPPQARGDTDGAGPGPVEPVARRSLDVLGETEWAANFDAVGKEASLLPRGVGSLTARRAGSSVERQPLRLVDQKVTVTIDGRLAHTEVEQAFHNDAASVMEGIYRFPLPSDASISGLSLLVGNTWMEGEMLEKRRARQIFREIVDATVPRDPALLQWEQGNVFKLNIFPIPARGERKIRLRYTQVLPESGEYARYRYPLGGTGATGTEIEHFSMRVIIDGHELDEAQLEQIRTPMMVLERAPDSRRDRLVLTASRDHFLPTWDLGVDVPLGNRSAAAATIDTHLDKDGQAYFMATLRPEHLPTPRPRPTSYAFVLDRSHGVAPELWGLSRAMVQTVIERMDSGDTFTVLACDTACDAFSAEPVTANEKSRDAALAFLDGQTLAGATDLGQMLRSGARSLDAATGDRDKVVVYLGDGVPSSGALTIDELGGLVSHDFDDARLLAVATGARSDLAVLDHLARVSGGEVMRADPRDDVGSLVRELVVRAEVPAAGDLELELPEGLMDVHPKTLPALRSGDELTVVGRMTRPVHGEIRLRSRARGGEVIERFDVDAEARREGGRNTHLPRTWAQAEIAHLTATQGASARETIVAMSRDYNVLSRWTALLVLENDRMYREFGVARKQDDKDAWSGDASGSGSSPAPVYGGAVDEAKKAEEATPAGAESAAEAIPDATVSESKNKASSSSASPEPLPEAEPSFEPPRLRRDGAKDRLSDDDEDPGDFEAQVGEEERSENAPLGAANPSTGASRQAPATKSARRPSKPRPKLDAMPDPWAGDDSFGGGGGGAYVPRETARHRPRPRTRHVPVRDAVEPSSRDLTRVAELRAERDRNPTDRKSHERLVKQAIYTGHGDARAFAAAWAEADPDYAPALLAHADLLAATGDPNAMRAYASAAEVRPFSERQHDWLARAYASKGDWTRSCSHRRALVSIDPARADLHVDLARCLDAAGFDGRAKTAIVDGIARAERPAALQGLGERLDREDVEAGDRLHGSPDLFVTLTWSGDADLDVALVDRRGRRLSAMRPENVRVREREREDRLTVRKVSSSIHVEVTRADSGTERVMGELVLKTPTTTRRIPVSLDRGTVRLARVSEQWR